MIAGTGKSDHSRHQRHKNIYNHKRLSNMLLGQPWSRKKVLRLPFSNPLPPPAPFRYPTFIVVSLCAVQVATGVVIMILMLMVDLTAFPTLAGWKRGPLLAVQNWPTSERRIFALVSRVLEDGCCGVYMMADGFVVDERGFIVVVTS